MGQTGLLLGAVQNSAGDSAPTAQTRRASTPNTASCKSLILLLKLRIYTAAYTVPYSANASANTLNARLMLIIPQTANYAAWVTLIILHITMQR